MNKKIVLSCWRERLDGGTIMRHYTVKETHNLTGTYPEDQFNLRDSYDPIDYLWHEQIITDEEYGYDSEKDKDDTKPYVTKTRQVEVIIKVIPQDNPQHHTISWNGDSSPISLRTNRDDSVEITHCGTGNYDAASEIASAINNVSESLDNKSNGQTHD
tara:strand:+ start:53 stop:526 length:474 start_codon:yes stop_codon:yes gene_type:complete